MGEFHFNSKLKIVQIDVAFSEYLNFYYNKTSF